MRYFLYCRKSSDREDRQILGPEAQKRLLLEHAERRELVMVEIYVEHQTAYKTGRPLFNDMLRRLERGDADGILTYHLTRLARNSFDGGRLIYMMDEGTVQEIATPEKSYTNNSDDKFMMQIHFAMAKKSSDDTSQFVRRDVESKLLRGEYPGMVPPGYLNINRDGHISKSRDSREKYLLLLSLNRPLQREEIDPIDGPLVHKLFLEAAKGTRSLPALRKYCDQLGLLGRGGKKLSRHAVWNILTNPYYYGVIEYNGKIYTENIRHEPLISKALFTRVQDAIGRREKGRYRRHAFVFGGCVMRCGECACPITAERHKGHVYYHCTGTRGACSQSAWTREEVIEDQFTRILARLRLPQSYLDFSFAKLRKCSRLEAEYSAARRRSLQGQVNACQQKFDSLLQLKISPDNANGSLLSDEEYLRQKTVIKEELSRVSEELAAVQQLSETRIEDCEQFFSFTQRLAVKFKEASVDDKRAVLLLICSTMTLKDHELTAEYREPYDSLACFPLAGKSEETESVREKVLAEAENPQTFEKWLGILTAIRTFWLKVTAASSDLAKKAI